MEVPHLAFLLYTIIGLDLTSLDLSSLDLTTLDLTSLDLTSLVCGCVAQTVAVVELPHLAFQLRATIPTVDEIVRPHTHPAWQSPLLLHLRLC